MHDIGSPACGESIKPFHPRNPEHDDIENVELDAVAVKLDSRILLIGPFYVLFVYFFISDIATSKMFSVTVAGAVGPGRVLANWRMSQIRTSRLGCLAENATSRVGCLNTKRGDDNAKCQMLHPSAFPDPVASAPSLSPEMPPQAARSPLTTTPRQSAV